MACFASSDMMGLLVGSRVAAEKVENQHFTPLNSVWCGVVVVVGVVVYPGLYHWPQPAMQLKNCTPVITAISGYDYSTVHTHRTS